jgi:hypothetical protein
LSLPGKTGFSRATLGVRPGSGRCMLRQRHGVGDA